MASPLEQFVIKPIVPIEIGGVDVSFTQSSLWMGLAVLSATLLMTLGMRKKSIIPGRMQNIPEMLCELVYGMLREQIGPEARKYFPFVFSVFMIVFMGNMLGMLPYSFTYTSHIIVTLALAVMVFVVSTAIGFIRHGTHFFSFFLPPGLPVALAPLLIVIELISYLSRPISLSVRLFANMVAGHTMLKIFAGFSAMLAGTLVGTAVGILPVLANTALITLEFLIAFIQAYVFTILTCIYLKDAIELH